MSDTPTLTIHTWNLNGLEDDHLDLRMEAACLAMLLRDPMPHVVLLQEVVRRSFYAHLRPHLIHAGFTIVPEQLSSDSDYFCVLASRLPVREAWRRPFEGTMMGRALLGARLALSDDSELLVMTSHLESTRWGEGERRRQFAEVCQILKDEPGPAVFAGDTNLRIADVEATPAATSVEDAWMVCGSPKAAVHTWSPRGKSHPRIRYDRAYYNLHPGWRATAIRTFGAAAVAGTGGLSPSDHLAVEVTFEVP